MEPEKYVRKWAELNRTFIRLKKYYESYIQDGLDSFQGPKDFVNNLFRISYELKESLKKSSKIPEDFKGYKGKVEKFCNSDKWVALSLDIANLEKHLNLTETRSGKRIGPMTSHIHMFDPNGKDRTELKIEINGQKEDCLELASRVVNSWEKFLNENNLLSSD